MGSRGWIKPDGSREGRSRPGQIQRLTNGVRAKRSIMEDYRAKAQFKGVSQSQR